MGMKFVKTGITEFDNLLAGKGYPKGNQILVLGGPGTGKSIFGLQYLYKGATELGENGIYVTLDETPDKMRRNVSNFGWDLKNLENNGKLIIIDAISARLGAKVAAEHYLDATFDISSMLRKLEKAILEIDAKRLVLDSLSIMGLYSQGEHMARTNMLRMANALSGQVTTLIISESRTENIGIREFPYETFLFDGMITLTLDPETQERRIAIRKMRGTKHVLGSFKFQIGDMGISLTP